MNDYSAVIVYISLVQVYDATKFLEEHPGGDEIILKSTGTTKVLCWHQ